MLAPFISVVIPTYGREEVLCETLNSVLQQDYSDATGCQYEIIVVDQTVQHKPATQVYLDQLIAAKKIRYFQVNWASLPGARNYAVRRSRGDIILFLDDDVQLPAGCLAAHARNYERPDIGAVAGRVFDRMKLADDPDSLIEDLSPAASDPGI